MNILLKSHPFTIKTKRITDNMLLIVLNKHYKVSEYFIKNPITIKTKTEYQPTHRTLLEDMRDDSK